MAAALNIAAGLPPPPGHRARGSGKSTIRAAHVERAQLTRGGCQALGNLGARSCYLEWPEAAWI